MSLRLLLSLLLLASLLTACSFATGVISNPFNKESYSGNLNKNDGQLTVLTVEYGSGSPVSNMNVQLTDLSTGDTLDSSVSSNEGEAVFTGLEEGKKYLIAASLLENDYPLIEEITYKKTKVYHVIRTNSVNSERIPIPIIIQNPELPNGCEITSLTAVLNYYGLELSKTEMAKKYLPQQPFSNKDGEKYGADPNKAYTGSPFEKYAASYVYAAPIAEAAKKVISDHQLALKVSNMSNQSPEDIIEVVNQGIPVVIWVTLDLTEPVKKSGWIIEDSNKYHEMYKNLHSVVLTGIGEHTVTVMDPLKGNVQYDKEVFFKSYEALGKQAVAIYK